MHNSITFSKFIELCDHYRDPVLEHFHRDVQYEKMLNIISPLGKYKSKTTLRYP